MKETEKDQMVDLLKRFSQEYCCTGIVLSSYCENCELNKKGLCQTIVYLSEYLNDEITERRMIQEVLFDYKMREEEGE